MGGASQLLLYGIAMGIVNDNHSSIPAKVG